jgi:hypothetical protein
MLDLDQMLEFLLTKQPPADPTKPIHLKISFDGGTMTSGKRIQEEIGTLQVLSGLKLHEVKSHTTAHQWIIYIGREEYEELQEELETSLPKIQRWIDNGKVLLLSPCSLFLSILSY